MTEVEQLAAVRSIHELFEEQGIEYWMFGGWAVDFHAGSVTRVHDDLDIAVWLEDRDQIAALLRANGWSHAPEPHEDGYTGYERDAVRLELAFLARSEGGSVHTPLRVGRATWPDRASDAGARADMAHSAVTWIHRASLRRMARREPRTETSMGSPRGARRTTRMRSVVAWRSGSPSTTAPSAGAT